MNKEYEGIGGRAGRGGASGIDKATYTTVGVLDIETDKVIQEAERCQQVCFSVIKELLEERDRLYDEATRRYREKLP